MSAPVIQEEPKTHPKYEPANKLNEKKNPEVIYPMSAEAAEKQDDVKKGFVKMVAIGDSGVGKTSLVQMFENSKFTETFKPTLGVDFSNKDIRVNGKIVTL